MLSLEEEMKGSKYYIGLDFLLRNLIKYELPEDYYVNSSDINFLLDLNNAFRGIIFKFKRDRNCGIQLAELIVSPLGKELIESTARILKNDDPYELFIDAGLIDNKLNVVYK